MEEVTVIGGGLAGCEAAWALAKAGEAVSLYEMKPSRFSPAHKSAALAELVCSNSLKAKRTESAAGLLKAELRLWGSLCLEAADATAVPAGGALAVDREAFSTYITERICTHPLITLHREEVTALPENGYCICAAGPLASDALAANITALCGDALSFHDAAAPIVEADSIGKEYTFTQSRYDRGEEDDYINCPLDKTQYEAFHAALLTAERADAHPFDVYEGCMPIEVLASRGLDAIRFGPMKPVGLRDPRTGHRPWAVLQLRKENTAGTLYNLVGFQTNLKFSEQKRVFGMIPALQDAAYARYGVMHRNTFLNSPQVLNPDLSCKARDSLWFAGQITGTEGYMESAACGRIAAEQVLRRLHGLPPLPLPPETMIGALLGFVTGSASKDFQPMGANFGLLPPLPVRIRDKQARNQALSERALSALREVPGASRSPYPPPRYA
ncbi:MAG: methylenetetrahydrofolate--tRNA-(uracil(54)-C(5))-methyltransferase (FADH(2)-oxidizing) TrmFO [Oscillospiraceae bacterium]|jgi:methylenetetrahydrofolate--tRNA-(uracil-5-)-methyltransferase|nr:methylenetetrahydrofolate--tRNA-(uracil(54)-C(5))-methyltransferase (FADH(2)-oxidizing) TrmFO [Oscillospiraceae bacterium]